MANSIDMQYRALATAIVSTACTDYLQAYRKYKKTKEGTDAHEKASYEVARNAAFFRSKQFMALTERDIDPDILMNRLQYLAENSKVQYFPIIHNADGGTNAIAAGGYADK